MVAVVAHTSIPGTGGGPGPFTSSAIDTTGATLLVIVTANAVTWDPVISDSKGNTWNSALDVDDVSNNSHLMVHYAYNPTVGSGHTVTVDGALNFISAEVAAFSGIKTTANPVDQTNTGRVGSAATVQPGSITPSVGGALIVCGLGTAGPAGISASINSGFAITDQLPLSSGNYYGSALAWLAQGSAAAVNPTWTEASGSHDLTAGIVSFLPGPASVAIAITESPDVVAATLNATNAAVIAITESADSVAATLSSTFNIAVAITESPDVVDIQMLAEGLLAIAITESPDAVFASLGYDINIAITIGSEDADTVSIVLDNPGSWSNCTPIDTTWTDCTPTDTTWTNCTNPSTDWTMN